MPLKWLRSRFEEFRGGALRELAAEMRDEPSEDLIEAVAAATALVAFADGARSEAERDELLAVFEEEDTLTDVDLDELFDVFDDYSERFAETDPVVETEALAAVAVFDDEPDLGRMIIRAAVAVAGRDGELSPGETHAVERLCDALGLEVTALRRPVRRTKRDAEEEDEAEDDES